MMEGNVLFNDVLNAFYLRLYCVRRMVKDHSDSDKGNSLPQLHGLFCPISSKRHPTDRIIHTTAFVTPAVGHWLEREIARTSYEDKINDEVIHVFFGVSK